MLKKKKKTGSFTNGPFLLIQFPINGPWKGQLVSKLLQTSCCVFPGDPMGVRPQRPQRLPVFLPIMNQKRCQQGKMGSSS